MNNGDGERGGANRNPAVEAVQNFLSSAQCLEPLQGEAGDKPSVDGVWGENSIAALEDFYAATGEDAAAVAAAYGDPAAPIFTQLLELFSAYKDTKCAPQSEPAPADTPAGDDDQED